MVLPLERTGLCLWTDEFDDEDGAIGFSPKRLGKWQRARSVRNAVLEGVDTIFGGALVEKLAGPVGCQSSGAGLPLRREVR
jgi:hypothetical protein